MPFFKSFILFTVLLSIKTADADTLPFAIEVTVRKREVHIIEKHGFPKTFEEKDSSVEIGGDIQFEPHTEAASFVVPILNFGRADEEPTSLRLDRTLKWLFQTHLKRFDPEQSRILVELEDGTFAEGNHLGLWADITRATPFLFVPIKIVELPGGEDRPVERILEIPFHEIESRIFSLSKVESQNNFFLGYDDSPFRVNVLARQRLADPKQRKMPIRDSQLGFKDFALIISVPSLPEKTFRIPAELIRIGASKLEIVPVSSEKLERWLKPYRVSDEPSNSQIGCGEALNT